MNNDLYKLLEDFLVKYLPKERGYSNLTVGSYYTGIKQFLSYYSNKNNIKLNEITFYYFTFENISEFLNYLEDELKNSISTRNQRMASILSFCKYVGEIEPKYINLINSLNKIRVKKTEKRKLDFLTVEEYQVLIKTINLKTALGLKHYTLINVLYDTGARVQELIDMKLEDFNFGRENSVKILGKGNKHRLVYINKHSVTLIQSYIKRFNIKSGYLFKNKQNNKLTRFGVEYIVNKYYELACNICETLKNKHVTPHTMRHTKACHFLIMGTSIAVIQRFLGHSSIKTTEVYLDITSDVVIKAVEQAGDLVFGNEEKIEKVWVKEEDILEKIAILFKED